MAKACERLGLELVRGQKTFRGYSIGTCEHAIRVKDGAGFYEIGLTKRADGAYDLKWDGHMGASYSPAAPLYDKVGYATTGRKGYQAANTNKLLDWYAAEVARKQMSKQGFMVRTVQQQGKVQVLCSK